MTIDSLLQVNSILDGSLKVTPTIIENIMGEINQGLSLRHIARMLESDAPDVVEGATFIISELNPRKHKGVEKLAVRILSFPDEQNRYHGAKFFYYYDAIDNNSLWPLILLLGDEAYNPRRMAMMALYNVGDYYWNMAKRRKPEDETDSALVESIKFLLLDKDKQQAEVIEMLDSESRIDRSIGLLSAIKLLQKNRKFLEYAASIDDDAVVSVAKRKLN